MWIAGNGLRLKTEVIKSDTLSPHPVVVVVLHGDSPFENPSYQYVCARRAAARMQDVVVAAILRPGYVDDANDRSAGVRGTTTGDNYTPQDIDAIAHVVEQLKARFHPAAVILVGHSGGATIAGDILGRWPSMVDAALLVSCPCVLGEWRRHMLWTQMNPLWMLPVKSISPLALAGRVRPGTKVWLVAGSRDDVAPPRLSLEYAEALRDHGVDERVSIAPNLTHDILLELVVMEQMQELIRAVMSDGRPRRSLGPSMR